MSEYHSIKRLCTFPGCDKKHWAKGLCNSHLAQANRCKTLTALRPRILVRGLTCSVDSCRNKMFCRSFCRIHYQRWHHHGNTDLMDLHGEKSPFWKGDSASKNSGRRRARKIYPLGDCERCGKPATERHHKDDNTFNNDPDNIMIVCRSCHMAVDGRTAKLAEYSRQNNHPLPPKPCEQCNREYKPLRRGLCSKCYDRKRYEDKKSESSPEF